MPAINAAIARMHSDGRLSALRAKHSIDLPLPAPEVMSVGVPHIPPHWIVREDGSFSGFNVEVIQDLAARANLKIRLEAIDVAAFLGGPDAAKTDLIAGLVATPARRAGMDFSFSTRAAIDPASAPIR